jgi:pimeloyl-ACP methyl ester carboxylesterase
VVRRLGMLAIGVLAAAWMGPGVASASESAAERVGSALGGDAEVREVERGKGWIRTQFALHDEPTPLVVDVLASTQRQPSRVAYLFPGGGLNFEANFFTPSERNISHFLRSQGYLVVGISPREDGLDPVVNDPLLAGWGLAKHKQDARGVIAAVNRSVRLPYDVLGHSAGGALALDYAATYNDGSIGPGRVMVIDTTGPYAEPDLRQRATESLATVRQQLANGQYVQPGSTGALISAAVTNPGGASALPWPPDPALRFTNAGAAHFLLINTGRLPGLTNWIYHGGIAAGSYSFGATPAEDRFALTHSPLSVLRTQAEKTGSEAVPAALIRDLLAIWAGDESVYRIDWSNIRAEVAWVNAELGRGDHPHGADLIRQAGNEDVSFAVVPGYGHGDPVWSTTAAEDYWSLLSPTGTSGP